MLAMKRDGYPYLRMDQACFLIGIVGLNELVRICKGSQLHESDEALIFGLKLIAHMKNETEKLSQKYGLNFILEQTPAETTAYRFARLDLRYYSPKAGHFVRGDISKGEVYYTNSTHLSTSASVDPIERTKREGRFHPLIKGGGVTQVWLGDVRPSSKELVRFITKAFRDTENDQVMFCPEFTTCRECGRTFRCLKEECQFCGSKDVEGIARITQYFSRISGWNRGKLAELRDRKRYDGIS
jgi:ribonucleoside-triphosphate reductase